MDLAAFDGGEGRTHHGVACTLQISFTSKTVTLVPSSVRVCSFESSYSTVLSPASRSSRLFDWKTGRNDDGKRIMNLTSDCLDRQPFDICCLHEQHQARKLFQLTFNEFF